ncbi:MAG: lipopolysaccharide biosynthesis protein [Acidimicrobiales bacterium]
MTQDDGDTALGGDSRVVGVSLLIAGVLTYAFLAMPARVAHLSPEAYAPFAVTWFGVLTVGSGLFVPLEQEITRQVAARRSGSPVPTPDRGRHERSPATTPEASITLAWVIAAVLVVVGTAAWGPVRDNFLEGSNPLMANVLAVVPAFALFEVARGLLAGSFRFTAYGAVVVADAGIRLAVAVAAVVFGVTTAGPFAFGLTAGMGLAGTAGAVVAGLRWRPAPWPAVGRAARAFAPFSLSQLLAQTALNSPVLLAAVVGTASSAAATGRLGSALVLVRTPLYFLPAVTAPLLPRVASGADLRRPLVRGVAVLVSGGLATAVGAAVVGPAVIRLLFGAAFALPGPVLGLLVVGSVGFAVASVATVVLLGRDRTGVLVASWAAAVAVASAAVALGTRGGPSTGERLVEVLAVGYALSTTVAAVIQLAVVRTLTTSDPVGADS